MTRPAPSARAPSNARVPSRGFKFQRALWLAGGQIRLRPRQLFFTRPLLLPGRLGYRLMPLLFCCALPACSGFPLCRPRHQLRNARPPVALDSFCILHSLLPIAQLGRRFGFFRPTRSTARALPIGHQTQLTPAGPAGRPIGRHARAAPHFAGTSRTRPEAARNSMRKVETHLAPIHLGARGRRARMGANN